jgi:hypothetical protein
MGLINNKKEFLGGIGLIVETDQAAIMDLMPGMQLHTKEEIVYDSATVEGVAPEYTSFSETANVISKDGKDRVTLKPVNFNDAISKETIDADAEQFGQNEYGDGTVDATMQSALIGVGKLKLNAEVGKKKIFYEALTTHKIAGGYIGKNGKEDIVFNVPATNKEVFDGTVKKYWSDTASATPVNDIDRAYKAMKIKPSRVIMNDTTYGNFLANAQVITADNSSTGVKKNFTLNENVSPDARYYEAGKLRLPSGKTIAIMVEEEQRFTGTGYTPFMPDGYVVYASPRMGKMHYGGIPVAETGGVRRIAAMEDVTEIITQNPPQHSVQYRTAPLPALEQGEAYYSQKVEA